MNVKDIILGLLIGLILGMTVTFAYCAYENSKFMEDIYELFETRSGEHSGSMQKNAD